MMRTFKITENIIEFKKDLSVSNQSRLAFSILNLFSYTLRFPRILINSESFCLKGLSDTLKQNATVKVLNTNLAGIFSFATNFSEFDLGIFIIEKNNYYQLVFYSGSGYILNPVKINNLENSLKNAKKTQKNVNFYIENLKVNTKDNKYTLMQKKEADKKLSNIFKIYHNFLKSKIKVLIKKYQIDNDFKFKKIYLQDCNDMLKTDKKLLKKYFKFKFIKTSEKVLDYKNKKLFFKIGSVNGNIYSQKVIEIYSFGKLIEVGTVNDIFKTYEIKVADNNFSDTYSLFKSALENEKNIYFNNGLFTLFEGDFTFNVISEVILLSILLT